MKIIQNAVKIVESGQFLVSSHTHDFVCAVLKNGEEVFVDGGRDYFRRTKNSEGTTEDYSLTDESSLEDMKNKFLCFYWKDGKNNWKRFIDLNTENLKNMLQSRKMLIPVSKSYFGKDILTIEAILMDRQEQKVELTDDFI